MNPRARWHVITAVVSFCCFFNSLENGLVHDDIFAIRDNGDVRPSTPLSNLFWNDFWGKRLLDAKSHKSYRPLCILSFRMNFMFHELQPFGYHLVNVISHIVVVNLFFFILDSIIFKDTWLAGITSLMFATHPVHVEAVTGVVGRADVLSCILFLLTYYYYVRHAEYSDELLQKQQHTVLFTKDFLTALFTGSSCLFMKEHSVTVFGVCIAYDVIRKRQFIFRLLPIFSPSDKDESISFKELSSLIKRVLFISIWVVMLFLFRLQLMGNQLPPFKHEDNPASFSPYLTTRVLTYLYLLSFNAQMLLAPYILCYDWQVGSIPLIETVFDLRNISTLVFLVILLLLVVVPLFAQKQERYGDVTLIAVVFLVLPFLPASNFFLRVGFVVAERILYIPSLGFCMLVALGLKKIAHRIPHAAMIAYTMFFGLIVLFCLKTVSYNRVWNSRESLFKSGIATLPQNAKVHYNYANFLSDNKRKEEAVFHYQEAVRLYPSHSSAHNNLGILLRENPEQAKYHFLQALKYTPGHYRAMFNLAGIYRNQQKINEAEEMLRKTLGYNPRYFDAQLLLADVLKDGHKNDEAFSMFQMLYNSQPTNENVFQKYAEFLAGIGKLKESIQIYEKALRLDERNFIANFKLAKTYSQAGDQEKAKTHYERAISTDPSASLGYQGLANFLYQSGDYTGAKRTYERMIERSLPTPEHLRNYAVVLFRLNYFEEAIKKVEELIDKDKYHVNAHYTLINFMMDRFPEKALKVISRALEIFPSDTEMLLQLASVKRTAKNYSEAEKIYLEIIRSKPNHFHALMNIGTIYHLQQDLTKAEQYYDLAYAQNPNDGNLQENMKKIRRLRQRQRQ